jgi:gliding motility-associated-like protein
VFTIDGIEKYPDNVVEIYNRWGVLVYEQKGYNNTDKTFNGFSQGRSTINTSMLLPEGTYYYFVSYVKNSGIPRKISGYLFLKQ